MVECEGKEKITTREFFNNAKENDGKKLFQHVEEEFYKGKIATKVMFLQNHTKMATKYINEKHNRECLKIVNVKFFNFNTSVKKVSTKHAEIMERKLKEELEEREFSKKEENILKKATYDEKARKGTNNKSKGSFNAKKKNTTIKYIEKRIKMGSEDSENMIKRLKKLIEINKMLEVEIKDLTCQINEYCERKRNDDKEEERKWEEKCDGDVYFQDEVDLTRDDINSESKNKELASKEYLMDTEYLHETDKKRKIQCIDNKTMLVEAESEISK